LIPTTTHPRSRSFASILFATAILLLAAGVPEEFAMAQEEGGSAALMLTLNGAVDLALKQNLDLQTAHIETAIRQQDRMLVAAALLPSAELDADGAVMRYNTKAQLGIQPAVIPHEVRPYQTVHAGTRFSAPIFDLTLIRQYQASGHRLLATRADEATVREEMVLLTVSEYMAHLRALASISAAQSRVDLADRLVRQAEDLLKDGVATKIDVSRAQVRLSEDRQQLIDAQSDAETTLFALKRTLNVPDDQQVDFADRQDFFSTPSLYLSDSFAVGLHERPEIESLSEEVKAARLAHKAAVAASLPRLDFEGGWNEQGETFAHSTPGYDYRVDVRVPIFTGGRLRPRESALLSRSNSPATGWPRSATLLPSRCAMARSNCRQHFTRSSWAGSRWTWRTTKCHWRWGAFRRASQTTSNCSGDAILRVRKTDHRLLKRRGNSTLAPGAHSAYGRRRCGECDGENCD
jgi:outer membrane protein